MTLIFEADPDKLAKRLARGDKKAAGRLFDIFGHRLFGYFLSKTANRHASEDLVQETFLKALDRIDTFDPGRGSFSAWLWGIGRNALTDHFRSARRSDSFSDLADQDGELPEFPAEREGLGHEDKFLVEKAWEVIRTFPPEEQEILVLHYISDLDYREISARTGRSEGALRVLVHRLHKKIRDRVQ